MLRTQIICLLLFGTTSIFGQSDVFSEISNSSEHKILTELLLHTGLDELLKNDNYYSVFAPNDQTFSANYSSEELDSLKLNDPELLKSILLRHIVPDTIELDFISGPYLPLQGSHLSLYVDAAANVLIVVSGYDSANPTPRLEFPFYSDDVMLEVDNGRILWSNIDLIKPSQCKPLTDLGGIIYDPLFRAVLATNLYDSISLSTEPLTFIIPRGSATLDYIDANGGMQNTPFLDSFVHRHIIKEHLPLQSLPSDYIAENLLGESVVFSKKANNYFVNDSKVETFIDYKNAIVMVVIDHIENPIISNTEHVSSSNLKIFPNPATGFLKLQSSQHTNKQSVNIISLDGTLILKDLELKAPETIIDVSDFQSGLYFLQYRSGLNVEILKLIISTP